METSIFFAQDFAVTMARIGLVVLGLSLAYVWRIWALNESLGN